jgi:hypothetical protein
MCLPGESGPARKQDRRLIPDLREGFKVPDLRDRIDPGSPGGEGSLMTKKRSKTRSGARKRSLGTRGSKPSQIELLTQKADLYFIEFYLNSLRSVTTRSQIR